ncbi:hypothetical protein BLNAU_16221 [Blattamonas nauphoetae]|uniref:Uncharacterized protein n=1 Tax=Blattamonas nauphoetae TaxID=2049346 RepID=A0ABQ9X8H7_9EUKA|nr:hypothetical protein BLNAU_16221 [Blattamonas nauphoetae]
MNTIIRKTDTSSSVSLDVSPFLNWEKSDDKTPHEKGVVFRSLIATLKLQPALDDSLEAKAVKCLKSLDPNDGESADAFLSSLASNSYDSLTVFIQCVLVLVSSTSRAITTAAMVIQRNLILLCSFQHQLALVKTDLIPELVITLNPQSLSFSEAADIHACLLEIIATSLRLATPEALAKLEIEDRDDQQAVHETVLQQVLVPSEKYICNLCVNSCANPR